MFDNIFKWSDGLPADSTDLDAIHDNVSGEIAAITEKTSLADDDLILIEDSAATNAKKKSKISTFLAKARSILFLNEITTPSTPPSGQVSLYVKDGGILYIKDDLGVEKQVILDKNSLGLESLSDPNADRILFWDDSAGALKWLAVKTNLSISDTNLNNDNPKFVPRTSPLTSTAWDGNSRSTTAKTLIDLSEVFGVPANIKAISAKASMRDSGSAAGRAGIIIGPTNVSWVGRGAFVTGIRNDAIMDFDLIVPCNADGDVYYQIIASGTETIDVWLQIWGYWI